MNTVKIESLVELSPAQIARLFCNMSSTEQADVFAEIGRISREEWTHGDMQWAHLGCELLGRGAHKDGWQFAASIGAFTMNYAFSLLERREREFGSTT